jgi:serine/threonine protein kinase/WD40 repeat protein/Tfp pilus assembly protein PilF
MFAMNEDFIFLAALEQGTAEARAAYLDRACAGNAELREGVERLLRAHERADEVLAHKAQGLPATVSPSVAERAGMEIGPYKLLEQIGEGGFGVVFMAEQHQPVRRRVALKVIKPGMDTRHVIARFEQERQALALMDHPNIAKVIDAGTTESGRPYFVMELIRGVPITQYCDQHRLAPKERLELFVSVCQAVQHAHQKGIIHRDLKPTNVLVTLHDGQPLVKVIDFGVAKATGQQLTEKTLFTNFAQMIGTPLYMSPEQAELTSQDIDTRSDIYSLGVLMYELLTGTTPFEKQRFQDAAFDEIRRIILEEEPPRPSLRLSSLGDTLPSISALRHMEPGALRKLVRGELDWIVMKCLEKDRNRRYETANGLAMDLQRYLADEPVLACPPTISYRLRKLVRRYRGAMAVSALLLLALVAGILGTSWGMIRARSAAGKLKVAVTDLERASGQLESALDLSEGRRFESLLNEARAWGRSRGVGQRTKAIAAVREAAKIRITPELRDAAAAALVLPDIEVVTEWEGLPAGTESIACDATFQTFARIDRQKGVIVFRLIDGREEVVATLPMVGAPPYFGGIVMSPDGRFLASTVGPGVAYSPEVAPGVGNSPRDVTVWDLTRPQSPLKLSDQPVQVSGFSSALAFHPDSRQLATGHPDGTVSVYDLPSGKRLHHLHAAGPAKRVAFHPKANRLAVGFGRIVQLFDLDSEAELPPLKHSIDAIGVNDLAWHPDGRRLATGCNGRLHWWDAETATELTPSWDLKERGIQLAFNHAGDLLITKGWSGQALLWDVASGRMILNLAADYHLQFSADNKVLGLGQNGTTARLAQIATGSELRILAAPLDSPDDCVWWPVVHKDGRLAMTYSRRALRIWDLETSELLTWTQMPQEGAYPFAYDSAKGWMTWGSSGYLLWPVSPAKDDSEKLIVGPPSALIPGPSSHQGVSAEGNLLAKSIGHSTLLFDRTRPDVAPREFGPQHDVRFCAISPDHQWLATGSHWFDRKSKGAFIWSIKTGLRHGLPLEGSTPVRFSPDSRWLATANVAGSDLWEAGTWRRVHHFDRGAQTAFSPDSRLMALGDAYGVIRICETETAKEIARLTSPEPGWYQAECFTPDGTKLLAGSFDDRIYAFDLRAIREGLEELELDWGWPSFPPAVAKPQSPPRIEIDTKDARAYTDLGYALLSKHDFDGAIAAYSLGIKQFPDDARLHNALGWLLATCPDAQLRDPKHAVKLATRAIELDSQAKKSRNTLGVAHYRAGHIQEAIVELTKSMDERAGGDAFDWFFLAMAHRRLGEKEKAAEWFGKAVEWMDKNAKDNEELIRFRAEADELLK